MRLDSPFFRSTVPPCVMACLLLAAAAASAAPQDDDLNLLWIQRLPEIDYVPNSPDPAVEGWPALGSTVTWHAVVQNWSTTPRFGVGYRWLEDDVEIASGTVDLAAQDTTGIDLPWTWTFERHTLRCEIDPADVVVEFEEGNNAVELFTDAITVGFYVEQSVWDSFHQYQHELGLDRNSWADWGQYHITRWNQMFADAIHPDTPQGVLDRIRLDKITIVADDALPLAWGYYPSNHPNTDDRTIDLQWGFAASLLNGSMYDDHTTISDLNHFHFEGSLLHELGHARYLVDVYGFEVHDFQVQITEDGAPVAGNDRMPILWGSCVYEEPYEGLMDHVYTEVDPYSAAALNLIAGHRAHNGNFNAPYNIGEFLQDLPQHNVRLLRYDDGRPLAGATLEVYRAAAVPGAWYGKTFDDVADLTFTADATGAVDLGHCPWSVDGTITHYYELSNAVAIARIEHEGRVYYHFLSVPQANMDYWRGNTETSTLTWSLPSDVVATPPLEPIALRLHGAWPNPFNPHTAIHFTLAEDMPLRAEILDLRGRRVRVLADRVFEAGRHQLSWTGIDYRGRSAASGCYLYRIVGVGEQRQGRITLLE